MELPIWLKHFKLIRFVSFIAAILYNIAYFLSFLKFYSMVRWEDKDFETFSDIFIALAIVYNCLIHISIVPINILIVIKGLSMEVVQFGNDVAGTSHDKLSLSSSDLLQMLNPFSWIDFFWEPVLGYDAEDYIIENPDDEANYYKNWGK
jgi:hypothetical protein